MNLVHDAQKEKKETGNQSSSDEMTDDNDSGHRQRLDDSANGDANKDSGTEEAQAEEDDEAMELDNNQIIMSGMKDLLDEQRDKIMGQFTTMIATHHDNIQKVDKKTDKALEEVKVNRVQIARHEDVIKEEVVVEHIAVDENEAGAGHYVPQRTICSHGTIELPLRLQEACRANQDELVEH